MELNTSERRINQEVLEIFENAKLQYAIEEVTKSYRYQLIKLADAAEYLGPAGFKEMVEALDPFLEKIEQGRVKAGKTSGNNYIVINRDEPYINDIVTVLADNDHWDGQLIQGGSIQKMKDEICEAADLHLEAILELQRIQSLLVPIADENERLIGVALNELEAKFHEIHDKWSE